MPVPEDFNRAHDAQAQARAWLVHLRSGSATDADVQDFRRWCAAHPEHLRTVHAVSELWNALSVATTELAAEGPDFVRPGFGLGPVRGRLASPSRRAFIGTAVAAGVTWLAVKPPLRLWPAIGDFAADYRTGVGEQRQVALSKQITVRMNTSTRIDVLASNGQPHGVRLLAGEAEIVTAENSASGVAPARPFIVLAGRGQLQAQLARFDVRRDGNEVCVTCLSGSVSLSHPQGQRTLQASQQLVYDDAGVRPVTTTDAAVVTAWRRGLLVFNGVPLAQVVDEINRYRPGKLILRNAALADSRVEAQFPLAQLDIAVDLLGRLYDLRVVRLPGHIALLT